MWDSKYILYLHTWHNILKTNIHNAAWLLIVWSNVYKTKFTIA